jgi:pimeloyl-ACP methyl ester carboxylesterase
MLIRRVTQWAVAVLVPALSCAPTIAQRSLTQAPSPTGRLVDVGGYRLHLHCIGRGTPTIVLIPGAGDYSFDWSLIQPTLSRETRTCSYDRAGYAWSDLGPNPRTMRQEAAELRILLQKAGIGGPVLLVGHSIGGLIARIYAKEYPEAVTGIALVDPTSEDTQLNYRGTIVRVRESAKARPVPSPRFEPGTKLPTASAKEIREFAEMQRSMGKPGMGPPYDRLPAKVQRVRLWAESDTIKRAAIQEDFWPEELQAMHDERMRDPRPLRDIPLLILIASRDDPSPQDMSPAEIAQFEEIKREKRRQKEELVQLSSNSIAVSDPRSRHHIQLEDPDWLTKMLADELDAVRRHLELKRLKTSEENLSTLPRAKRSVREGASPAHRA